MMLLEVKNIKKTYQTKMRKTAAVSDVSFSLGKNDFVSVVGRSGRPARHGRPCGIARAQ